jgi:RND family efflux transporter MFP subunit
MLQPQVTGQVVELDPRLGRGGRFREGEVILTIDPRDYELAVRQARAAVERAEFDLRVERGRQTIAQHEWEMLEETTSLSRADRDLALRKPHLKNAQAALDAAKSSLEQAELSLERTVIRAPFNCLILRDMVDIGQLVNPQAQIAEIVGTDTAEVEVAVPVDRLHLIAVAGDDGSRGSKAHVIYAAGPGGNVEKEGHVLSICGDVDPAGRMACLLVEVADPFCLEESNPGTPLLQGTYVRVEIEGPLMRDVFVVPREAVREGGQVWVMDEDERLEVRDVSIAWRREDDVVIDEGLAAGDRVVTSLLPTPIPGMALRSPAAGDTAAPEPAAAGEGAR